MEDDLDTPRALDILEESVRAGDAGWQTGAEILGLQLGVAPAQREAAVR